MEDRVTILVADDEEIVRESLAEWLTDAGYQVLTAENADEAMEVLEQAEVQILITDVKMPGRMDGIELMRRGRLMWPGMSTVIMTAYSSVSNAITAMKEGAYDYVEKPFCPEKLELLIKKIIAHRELLAENRYLKHRLAGRFQMGDLIGKSPKMQEIFDLIRTVAPSHASVLIEGESGTGKELFARAIHQFSGRSEGPFVATNCAAIPETLLESELFGHEKGAFTGALARKKGRFELADKGSLFLDEIAEMSPSTQVHLLRALQEREFLRVGGQDLVRVDVRVVSATNREIRHEVDQGRFREDLFYRLNVVNIHIPPLRERREDIPLLAGHFLREFCMENNKVLMGFEPEAMEVFMRHRWPGNVRQLENAIEHAVVIARGERVTGEDLPRDLSRGGQNGEGDLENLKSLDDLEEEHIVRVLQATAGNRTRAAQVLGIQRMTLYNKIKAYGIDMDRVLQET